MPNSIFLWQGVRGGTRWDNEQTFGNIKLSLQNIN